MTASTPRLAQTVIAGLVAARDRHFTRVVGDTRHLATCRRGLWLGERERWTNDDGAGVGAPCSTHCLADRAAWDAAERWLAEQDAARPQQIALLEAS